MSIKIEDYKKIKKLLANAEKEASAGNVSEKGLKHLAKELKKTRQDVGELMDTLKQKVSSSVLVVEREMAEENRKTGARSNKKAGAVKKAGTSSLGPNMSVFSIENLVSSVLSLQDNSVDNGKTTYVVAADNSASSVITLPRKLAQLDYSSSGTPTTIMDYAPNDVVNNSNIRGSFLAVAHAQMVKNDFVSNYSNSGVQQTPMVEMSYVRPHGFELSSQLNFLNRIQLVKSSITRTANANNTTSTDFDYNDSLVTLDSDGFFVNVKNSVSDEFNLGTFSSARSATNAVVKIHKPISNSTLWELDFWDYDNTKHYKVDANRQTFTTSSSDLNSFMDAEKLIFSTTANTSTALKANELKMDNNSDAFNFLLNNSSWKYTSSQTPLANNVAYVSLDAPPTANDAPVMVMRNRTTLSSSIDHESQLSSKEISITKSPTASVNTTGPLPIIVPPTTTYTSRFVANDEFLTIDNNSNQVYISEDILKLSTFSGSTETEHIKLQQANETEGNFLFVGNATSGVNTEFSKIHGGDAVFQNKYKNVGKAESLLNAKKLTMKVNDVTNGTVDANQKTLVNLEILNDALTSPAEPILTFNHAGNSDLNAEMKIDHVKFTQDGTNWGEYASDYIAVINGLTSQNFIVNPSVGMRVENGSNQKATIKNASVVCDDSSTSNDSTSTLNEKSLSIAYTGTTLSRDIANVAVSVGSIASNNSVITNFGDGYWSSRLIAGGVELMENTTLTASEADTSKKFTLVLPGQLPTSYLSRINDPLDQPVVVMRIKTGEVGTASEVSAGKIELVWDDVPGINNFWGDGSPDAPSVNADDYNNIMYLPANSSSLRPVAGATYDPSYNPKLATLYQPWNLAYTVQKADTANTDNQDKYLGVPVAREFYFQKTLAVAPQPVLQVLLGGSREKVTLRIDVECMVDGVGANNVGFSDMFEATYSIMLSQVALTNASVGTSLGRRVKGMVSVLSSTYPTPESNCLFKVNSSSDVYENFGAIQLKFPDVNDGTDILPAMVVISVVSSGNVGRDCVGRVRITSSRDGMGSLTCEPQ